MTPGLPETGWSVGPGFPTDLVALRAAIKDGVFHLLEQVFVVDDIAETPDFPVQSIP
ncbi:MAG: hypothetical protein AAF368_13075 [Planctomycetota bacterium]